MSFEQEWERFYAAHLRSAKGARLEHLKREKSGEKKLFEVLAWPIFRSFEGWILEFEIVSSNGLRIYVDAYYEPLRFFLECEGYAVHADTITRDRFDFERTRIRTIGGFGTFIPFTRDQLDKKPDACRSSMFELLGRHSTNPHTAYSELTLHEREMIRYGLFLGRPFRMSDMQICLQAGPEFCRKVARGMMEKELIRPATFRSFRHHRYALEEKAKNYFL